ncbi:polyprenyl synthetase family protein [Hydrogenophilus islandicus]
MTLTTSRFDPERFEEALAAALATSGSLSARLAAAMRHALLAPGKRLRPQLVFAAGVLTDAPPEALTPFAVAVELIHTYSLIHDDLPAMDDDALRRGQPTVHVAFDEATAILAGDALQALAFEILAATPELTLEQRMRLVGLLARAAGAAGMVGGQALDIEAERQLSPAEDRGVAQLERLHRGKTGALIEAAVIGGALCGPRVKRTLIETLAHFAAHLGLAFQIVDDLLDTSADAATLGKTPGKDAERGKQTFVTLLGERAARARLAELQRTIDEALTPLGPKAAALATVARQVIERNR